MSGVRKFRCSLKPLGALMAATAFLAACGSAGEGGEAGGASGVVPAAAPGGSTPSASGANVRTAQALASASAQTTPQPQAGDKVDQLIVKYVSPANNARLEASDPAWSSRAAQADSIARGHAVRASHLRIMQTGAQVLKLSGKVTVQQAYQIANQIKQSVPGVEYAEPDLVMQAFQTRPLPYGGPAPADYADQWNLRAINAEPAWNLGAPRGEGVVIAVVDSGAVSHADLIQNTVPGYDFVSETFRSMDGDGRDASPVDPDFTYTNHECRGNWDTQLRRNVWHGTHVAGLAAAAGAYSYTTTQVIRVGFRTRTITQTHWMPGRMLGVAPGANLMPIRALGKCGGLTSDIVDGMLWAMGEPGVIGANGQPLAPPAKPAKVINMSLGGYVGSNGCPATYRDAIAKANARKVTVVVAAGNNGMDATQFAPAVCDGAITVAAHKQGGGRASYSNTGSRIDIAAPGGEPVYWGFVSSVDGGTDPYPQEWPEDVPSTSVAQNTGVFDPAKVYRDRRDIVGTSMAAPQVAGAAAYLLSISPELTPGEIKEILKTTADFPACSSNCGAGLLNLLKAAQAVRALNSCLSQPAPGTAGELTVPHGGAFALQRGKRYSYFAWVGSTTGNFEGVNTGISVNRWEPKANQYQAIPYARVILNHGWWLDDIKDDYWSNADIDVSLFLDDVHFDCRKNQWIAGTVSFGRTRYQSEPWWQIHNVNDNRYYENVVLNQLGPQHVVNGVMGDARLNHSAYVVKDDGRSYYAPATVRFTSDSSAYR